MKKILLALAILIGSALPAAAQGCGPQNPNCIVPTAPPGTSDNRAASTAFVQNAVTTTPISSAQLDTICGTNNRSLIRLTGTWQCEAYSAQFTVGSTLSIASLSWGLISGTPTTLAGYGITNARTQLTGNIGYYVNGNSGGTAACGPTGASTCSAGNDSSNCLTPATSCLTVQHVVNLIIRSIDLNGFTATVYPAHGSSNNYAFTCQAGPVIGQSVFGIQGDTTAPTAVTMVATTGVAAVKDLCTVSIDSVAMADNASNNASAFVAVGTGNYGHVDLSNITFGGCTICTALVASYGGSITLTGTNSVTGGENAFMSAGNGGAIEVDSQTTTLVGTPAFATAFAYIINAGAIAVNGSSFSGAATGPRCIIVGPLTVNGYDPNVVFPGSTNCTANNLIQSENIVSGTLTPGTSAFNLTATQPASPITGQSAVTWNITGAGSASQNSNAMQVSYLAGYTGSAKNQASNFTNFNAGTGSTLIPAAGQNVPVANVGNGGAAVAVTTGVNIGTGSNASGGSINAAIQGLAQIAKNGATNIGGVFSAINTGSTPVQIGVWASLNQTTPPSVSAAVIGDNGSTTNCSSAACPIALWMANGATVASVNATGGLTATLTNAATTSAVCFNTSTLLFSYDATVGTCNTSDERLKNIGPRIDNALERLLQINGFYYTYKDPAKYGAGEQIGVGAQTVEKVFPELVGTDANGIKSVAYDKLAAPIIEAMRELKADNDNLRACQNSWKCRIFGTR